MIKMKVKHFRDPRVVSGLQILQQMKKLPFKTKYNIGRIVDKIDSEQTRWDKIYRDLVLSFSEKDADGKIIHSKNPETGAIDPTRFSVAPGRTAEWQEAQEKFLDEEVSINRPQLTYHEFGEEQEQLDSAQIHALSFLFSDWDELEEGENDEEKSNVKNIKSEKKARRSEEEASH